MPSRDLVRAMRISIALSCTSCSHPSPTRSTHSPSSACPGRNGRSPSGGCCWQPGARCGRRVVASASLGPAALVLLALAALMLPRPVPRLVSDGPGTVIDYHAHTNASHDGRPGWTLAKLAAWHERQGFQATYVTDHNVVYDRSLPVPEGTSINLLPGVEWSVYGQHVVAIGPVEPLPRDSFQGSTARMI